MYCVGYTFLSTVSPGTRCSSSLKYLELDISSPLSTSQLCPLVERFVGAGIRRKRRTSQVTLRDSYLPLLQVAHCATWGLTNHHFIDFWRVSLRVIEDTISLLCQCNAGNTLEIPKNPFHITCFPSLIGNFSMSVCIANCQLDHGG